MSKNDGGPDLFAKEDVFRTQSAYVDRMYKPMKEDRYCCRYSVEWSTIPEGIGQ